MTGMRIAVIRLLCLHPPTTARFFVAAFGCKEEASSADVTTLRLGSQRLELAAASRSGANPALSNSTGFQHCAIIVSDMVEAMTYLKPVLGWAAISRSGPEHLPAASGGATAFKFRDPDGHPLQFLQLPAGDVPEVWRRDAGSQPCLGIDHSAITVADAVRSIAFYEGLGFAVGERHVNRGVEQARMDGLDAAEVEVITLIPAGGAPPHLELLHYRVPETIADPAADGSPFATRVELVGAAGRPRHLVDPDGHRIGILDR